MKKLLWVVSLLWCGYSFAQTTTFNKRIDTGYPFLNITEVLPTDSCYYAIGVITHETDSIFSVAHLFLRLSLEGEALWHKKLGTPQKSYESWGSGLFSFNDSGFVTVGITKDSIPKIALIKYNESGDTMFTKEFINPFYPEETFISAAQNVSPYNNDEISLISGIDADPDGGNSEIYWLRLNAEGGILNSFIYAAPEHNTPESQIIDENENITIGAFSHNIGQVNQNFTCQAQIFQIDSLGNQKWMYKTPASQLFSSARSILPTPDGGLIVGTGKGVETAINSSSGRVDWNPCFFKLNAARQMEWVREFRGEFPWTNFSMVKIVEATDQSGYLGISWTAETESIGELRKGTWLMKVSPQGDSLWVRYFTLFDEEPLAPEPMDLKATPDGGYIVCGAIDPPDDGGVHPLRYGWLLKLDEYGCLVPGCHLSTGTEEEAAPRPALALYPNPARDFLNFELRGARPAPDGVFRILDAQGRLLQTIPGREALGTLVVPVHDWAAGAYVVQYLEGGQARAAEQFLKVE